MDKLITKENIVITAMVIFVLIQSNLFATKLELANLKLELMEYSNTQSSMTESKIDKRLEDINHKLDKLSDVWKEQ